jgi:hypothetical protein
LDSEYPTRITAKIPKFIQEIGPPETPHPIEDEEPKEEEQRDDAQDPRNPGGLHPENIRRKELKKVAQDYDVDDRSEEIEEDRTALPFPPLLLRQPILVLGKWIHQGICFPVSGRVALHTVRNCIGPSFGSTRTNE